MKKNDRIAKKNKQTNKLLNEQLLNEIKQTN